MEEVVIQTTVRNGLIAIYSVLISLFRNYSSTPINPRRSASACSLPRLGSSPNDDLTEFLLHQNVNGNTLLFPSPTGGGPWQPSRDAVSFLNNHHQQQPNTNKSHWLLEGMATTTSGRRSTGSAQQRPSGNCATPSPSLSYSTNSGTLNELRLLSGTRTLGQSILHTPTLNGDGTGTQDNSMQELTNAIRSSPACGVRFRLLLTTFEPVQHIQNLVNEKPICKFSCCLRLRCQTQISSSRTRRCAPLVFHHV